MPGALTGNNGDTYIHTGTGVFYKKSAGSWSQVFSMQTGPQGPQGPAGINGTNGTNGFSVLNGAGNPSNLTTGVDGDFYINTSNYDFFGPKTNGDWGDGVSLIPPGISPGGTTGQALIKNSNADYDIEWFDFDTLYVKLAGNYANPSWISSLAWNKITGTPTTCAGYGITDAEPTIPAGLSTQVWFGDKTWQTLLDGSGKIISSLLPSYVDDVVEFANYASLPATGETSKIYITLDTNCEYRWSGSTYVELVPSPGSTDALAEGVINKYYTDARVALYSDAHYLSLHGTADNSTRFNNMSSDFSTLGSTLSQFVGIDPSNTYKPYSVSQVAAALSGNWLPLYGTADAATYWGNRQANFDDIVSSPLRLVATDNGDGLVKQVDVSQVQSWLGLGANAFSSTAYLSLHGTADNSIKWNSAEFDGSTTAANVGGPIVYDATVGKFRTAQVALFQSWLGLGANAYSSIAYLPLAAGSGNSLTNPLYITSNTSGIEPYHILMQAAGANPQSLEIGVNTTSGYGYIQSLQAGVSYNNTPLAIMPNGGKVLIGTTIDSGALLQVNGAITAGAGSGVTNKIGTVSLGQSGNGYPVVGANISYTTTANSYTYTNNDIAWGLDFGNGGSNAFRLRYAASGSAGAAINFTDFITVNPSGFVGIGYSADPTSGNKLAVNGKGLFSDNVDVRGFLTYNTYRVAGYNGANVYLGDIDGLASAEVLIRQGGNNILHVQSTGIFVEGSVTASAFHGTADNTTAWHSYSFDNSTVYSSGFDYIFARTTGNGEARLISVDGIQSWLGLGSNAFSSTAYLPLHGTADNSSAINGITSDISAVIQSATIQAIVGQDVNNTLYRYNAAAVSNFLGLGSAAFTPSSAYMTSAGGTLSGALSIVRTTAGTSTALEINTTQAGGVVQNWVCNGVDIGNIDTGGTLALGGGLNVSLDAVISGNLRAEQFILQGGLNSAPSSSSDTGEQGEIRYTSDYIYLCIGTNTWKRAALTTF